MSKVKNWGGWIAKQIFENNSSNKKIVNDALALWENLSERFVLQEIKKVKNNPQIYKHVHSVDN